MEEVGRWVLRETGDTASNDEASTSGGVYN